MQDTLRDEKNGKKQGWKTRKVESVKLSESYFRLGLTKKAVQVHQCGGQLVFREYADETKKLHQANFCKVRLCPMCTWRRSLKVFGQVSKVMDYVEQHNDYRYIFVTLTAKNVTGDKLSCELDNYFNAFNLLTKRKEFKAISKGWFRSLEVTHNWRRDDYHPHIHMIVSVKKSYFTEKDLYLSHNDWMNIWRKCLDVDYDPSVDVRAVKNKVGDVKDYRNAVAEVAKYAVKSSDLLHKANQEKTDMAVQTLDIALRGRRLVSFGGAFKDAHSMLNLEDAERGDLINTENEDDIRSDLRYVLVRYIWSREFGDYIKFDDENN